jgi:hypothetical protein
MNRFTPTPNTFLGWVQAHERAWGNQTYSGRPTLEQMLSAPVVVFWSRAGMEKSDKHYIVTLHDDLSALEKHFARLLMFAENDTARNRVVAIFEGGNQMRIAAVNVRFTPADPKETA